MYPDQAITNWKKYLIVAMTGLGFAQFADAATYANTATTFNWIDATTHTQVGYNTTPYKFNGTLGVSACGTTPPVLDDTISDAIPIGFNFFFGTRTFDKVRIMTNGRIQFVGTSPAYDNTTCGFGSPVTQLPIPNAGLNYTMRIFGNDLDPTLQSETTAYTTTCASRTGANACYVSFATLGAAPNRQFVVTWNNVPEWASASTTTGNYNVQIILQENGEFIYQYGTDVPGPGAKTGQVAWQVSTTDYEAPSVGYPQQNTAIRFYTPRPTLEYRMEQTAWSGAGQVIDSSSSARNGSPVGAAQTTADGKVCRGANIPASGTNAIDTGTAIPSVGNAGTVAFWYKANTAWSGAGTQDVQLLDATTANGQWFFLVRRGGTDANAGKLRFVVTDSSNTVRVVETAAIAVAANTWKHVTVTWNFNNLAVANNDKITIFVDGVQQAQTAFTSTTATLSPQIGTLYLGGSRSGIAGQGGTVNSTDGVLDEVNVFNYEAPLAKITQVMNQINTVCLHHYSVANAGSAPACLPPQVTITAHSKEHLPYTANTTINIATSDNLGSWSLLSGRGILTPGPNGTATYAFLSESHVVLALNHASTAGVTVTAGDGTFSAQENTALGITSCANGKFNACESAACVPTAASNAYAQLYTKLANTGFTLNFVALTGSGLLDASFNKTVAVNLLANANSPTLNATTNCPTTQTATVALGNVTFAGGRASKAVAAIGKAYRDVRVQFVCSAANCGTATTVCAPDAFAVRPPSFSTVTSTANADSSGASATNSPTIKTGAAFTLTANTGTPGYDAAPNVDSTKVQWPTPPANGRSGSGAGTLTGFFSTPAASANGNNANGTNFAYDEVGYFQFAAGGVYDPSYAGWSGDVGNGDCVANSYSNTVDPSGKYGCLIANTAATNHFGRFIPDHFDSAITAGCAPGAFTYSDQPFKLTITARNSSNGKTLNYSQGFARAVALTDVNVAGGTLAPLSLANTLFKGGETDSTVTARYFFTRGVPEHAPASVKVRASDPDGVTSSGSAVEDSTEIRVGRLWIGNAYGKVGKILTLPYQLQYWNGKAFVLNTNDSCTPLDKVNIALNNFQGLVAGSIPTASIGVSGTANGKGAITLPASNVAGSVDVVPRLDTGTPNICPTGSTWTPNPAGTPLSIPWLLYKWCGAGYDRDPVARATFGIFGSSDKKGPIYIRENF